MDLLWATICIYRLERNWFDFFLFKTHFLMLSFAPLYWILQHSVFFPFFLRNFGSLDEIFNIPLRGLCDWASGFNIHDCIWKFQLSISRKFCHSWPCLTFLQNKVLKKSWCLLQWWWSFLHGRCIRSPSGLHGLFLDMFFQRPNWRISRLKPQNDSVLK